MTQLFIDLETYSDIDLRKSNAYRYTESDQFQILMAAYALGEDPVRVVFGADIYDIPGLWDPSVEKIAHNAAFERIALSKFAPRQYELDLGFLPPEHWTDTQALAALAGYPQKLEQLAHALGGEQKDSAGTLLINWFCKPDRKGQRRLPEDHPEKWAQFVEYCRQDVVTLRDVHKKLPTWPTKLEHRVYLADQRINDRGIQVDTVMAQAAIDAQEDNKLGQFREMQDLTGLENPNSNVQLLGWLKGQGVAAENLQAATVTQLLKEDSLPGKTARVLELRQELALVAAKKYQAALDRVNADGRLRGSFAYHGAHTGRWAGRGVQLQNLPSASLAEKDAPGEVVDRTIAAAVLDLYLGFGADAKTLKALVRPMFTGPFTVVDYSAIEARVVAWLAGEEWALQAFRDGRDIYVETAERMGGMSRKEGKVAVLALGYNGGTGSLRAMGAEGSDEKLQYLVTQWRNANPAIVQFWADMQRAFRNGGQAGRITVEKHGRDRIVRLPSGRGIGYHDVRERWVEKWGSQVKQLSFQDPKPPYLRVDTYGGRLTENVTQAVARDVLAGALVKLEEKGYDVVGHVHDEVLVQGTYPVEEIAGVLNDLPAWAEGLPIDAAGYTCPRYRKD
ncbi:MAG: DNA polymerase [Eubacteriales bacterium]